MKLREICNGILHEGGLATVQVEGSGRTRLVLEDGFELGQGDIALAFEVLEAAGDERAWLDGGL